MRSLFSGWLPALGIVFVMMAILVVLGTFMEWIAIAFIIIPVFAPVVVAWPQNLDLNRSGLLYGLVYYLLVNIQIYFLSPPFGGCLA